MRFNPSLISESQVFIINDDRLPAETLLGSNRVRQPVTLVLPIRAAIVIVLTEYLSNKQAGRSSLLL